MADDDAKGAPAAPTSVRGTAAWRLKSAYAGAVRGIGKVLMKARVLPSEPPPRDHRIRHWLVSLTKVHDSLAIAELGVPWWTYKAIDAIDEWLSDRNRPIRVFEYGSGASTFWLAARVDQVYSVEHHQEFASVIGPELAKLANVEFLHVPAPTVDTPRIGSAKTGSEQLDFYDYVHAIDRVDGDFDLVVIDGRAREACLQVSRGRLRPGGVVVFDNTHRARYRAAMAASGMVEDTYFGLTPTLPYPDRTSVLREPGGPAAGWSEETTAG